MNLPAVLLLLFGSPFAAPAFPALTSPPPANLTGAYQHGEEWVVILTKVGVDKYTFDWLRQSDGMRVYTGSALQQGASLRVYWNPVVPSGWESGCWDYEWDGTGFTYNGFFRFDVRPR